MKRIELIIILLFGVAQIVPAQNRNTVRPISPTTETNSNRNTATQTDNKIPELIPAGIMSAQELENQRIEAMKIIELTTQLLRETSVSAKASLTRLNLLTQQLLSRKKIISILGQEMAEIDRTITTMTNEVEILDKDLEKTKENYTKSLQNQQLEHRSTQYKLLLILSADNLSQSYRRMRYMREYADWQKEESDRIAIKQAEIVRRKAELEASRQEKQELLDQRNNENKLLATEEEQQKKEVRELNTKQKDLQNLLTQKRKEADALNKQIERLIEEDIKNSEKNKTVATTATTTTESKPTTTAPTETAPTETTSTETTSTETASTEVKTTEVKTTERLTTETVPKTTQPTSTATKDSYVLLESEAILSRDFTNNKGKLPFPLTGQHTIISSFGQQQHQELSQVRTINNGIDIQTTAGSDACAIFTGVVTRVFVMPGYNNNVIIRHGDYLTVYSNLITVYVKAGDVVNARQSIGKIFTDTAKSNETILHFQLWKERTKLNPSAWIK